MSPQSGMSSKKANYSPGLTPIEGQEFSLAHKRGPEINSRACLWVLPRPRHLAQCWLTNQQPSLFFMSRLETPRAGSGPRNHRTELPFASSSAISLPSTAVCPGTQYSPTACWIEMSFNTFWHWWTKGDVLTALRGFKAAWISEQISISPIYSEIEFHRHSQEPWEFPSSGECNKPNFVGVNRQTKLVTPHFDGTKGPLYEPSYCIWEFSHL